MDLVAAGAALAMARGAPHLMGETHDTTADRYLESGTLAFRKLSAAVARAIEQARGSPSESLRLVVADVCQQVSATKIVAAAGNSDFESGLNEAQKALTIHAREDPSFLREMSSIRFGNYHELSPAMAASVDEALRRPLSPDLERAVVDLSVSVDAVAGRAHGAASDLSRFPDEGDMRAVIAFHSQGRATGSSSVDGALCILRDRGDGMDFGEMEPAKHVAQARLVANASSIEGKIRGSDRFLGRRRCADHDGRDGRGGSQPPPFTRPGADGPGSLSRAWRRTWSDDHRDGDEGRHDACSRSRLDGADGALRSIVGHRPTLPGEEDGSSRDGGDAIRDGALIPQLSRVWACRGMLPIRTRARLVS